MPPYKKCPGPHRITPMQPRFYVSTEWSRALPQSPGQAPRSHPASPADPQYPLRRWFLLNSPSLRSGSDCCCCAEEARSSPGYQSDVIAYQIRQSFKPGEITAEEANRVGYELALRFRTPASAIRCLSCSTSSGVNRARSSWFLTFIPGPVPPHRGSAWDGVFWPPLQLPSPLLPDLPSAQPEQICVHQRQQILLPAVSGLPQDTQAS